MKRHLIGSIHTRERADPPILRVLSLGAGVQSTTLALMAAEGVIERPDCAIFADTGWEPRIVYRHLDWLIPLLPFPVHVVTAGNIRRDTLDAVMGIRSRVAQPPVYVRSPDGSQGMLRRACTGDYKVAPIRQKIRELAETHPDWRRPSGLAWVEQWFGISLDEVHRMKMPDVGWIEHRYPLIELGLTRLACLEWLRTRGYPEPPKSSCVGCPYHNDAYWRWLRDHSPDEWAQAVEFDHAIRRGLPHVRGEAYLHRSMVPLDQVDLSTPEERGQITFDFEDGFGNECDGMCGV
ncbi:adenine nucleotide alpha hydrolase family protein [Caldinitratiruptor microaerophilus]|uniref:Phosphoadenosine phosphosulfate reductase n=1 Tax=Caldinitratiruptor microaerophilus TaxID=671077 RepID=A0AA35G990_9FIRM|nr:hypothetical protein [Caldinitratiruptor microaerophilus]BDG61910.1 hypothetical protein caldi_30000 [Caldinitratiruptor microaerophilus]